MSSGLSSLLSDWDQMTAFTSAHPQYEYHAFLSFHGSNRKTAIAIQEELEMIQDEDKAASTNDGNEHVLRYYDIFVDRTDINIATGLDNHFQKVLTHTPMFLLLISNELIQQGGYALKEIEMFFKHKLPVDSSSTSFSPSPWSAWIILIDIPSAQLESAIAPNSDLTQLYQKYLRPCKRIEYSTDQGVVDSSKPIWKELESALSAIPSKSRDIAFPPSLEMVLCIVIDEAGKTFMKNFSTTASRKSKHHFNFRVVDLSEFTPTLADSNANLLDQAGASSSSPDFTQLLQLCTACDAIAVVISEDGIPVKYHAPLVDLIKRASDCFEQSAGSAAKHLFTAISMKSISNLKRALAVASRSETAETGPGPAFLLRQYFSQHFCLEMNQLELSNGLKGQEAFILRCCDVFASGAQTQSVPTHGSQDEAGDFLNPSVNSSSTFPQSSPFPLRFSAQVDDILSGSLLGLPEKCTESIPADIPKKAAGSTLRRVSVEGNVMACCSHQDGEGILVATSNPNRLLAGNDNSPSEYQSVYDLPARPFAVAASVVQGKELIAVGVSGKLLIFHTQRPSELRLLATVALPTDKECADDFISNGSNADNILEAKPISIVISNVGYIWLCVVYSDSELDSNSVLYYVAIPPASAWTSTSAPPFELCCPMWSVDQHHGITEFVQIADEIFGLTNRTMPLSAMKITEQGGHTLSGREFASIGSSDSIAGFSTDAIVGASYEKLRLFSVSSSDDVMEFSSWDHIGSPPVPTALRDQFIFTFARIVNPSQPLVSRANRAPYSKALLSSQLLQYDLEQSECQLLAQFDGMNIEGITVTNHNVFLIVRSAYSEFYENFQLYALDRGASPISTHEAVNLESQLQANVDDVDQTQYYEAAGDSDGGNDCDREIGENKFPFLDGNREVYEVHNGFACDGCGRDPIVGPRYHCLLCIPNSFDFCGSCFRRYQASRMVQQQSLQAPSSSSSSSSASLLPHRHLFTMISTQCAWCSNVDSSLSSLYMPFTPALAAVDSAISHTATTCLTCASKSTTWDQLFQNNDHKQLLVFSRLRPIPVPERPTALAAAHQRGENEFLEKLRTVTEKKKSFSQVTAPTHIEPNSAGATSSSTCISSRFEHPLLSFVPEKFQSPRGVMESRDQSATKEFITTFWQWANQVGSEYVSKKREFPLLGKASSVERKWKKDFPGSNDSPLISYIDCLLTLLSELYPNLNDMSYIGRFWLVSFIRSNQSPSWHRRSNPVPLDLPHWLYADSSPKRELDCYSERLLVFCWLLQYGLGVKQPIAMLEDDLHGQPMLLRHSTLLDASLSAGGSSTVPVHLLSSVELFRCERMARHQEFTRRMEYSQFVSSSSAHPVLVFVSHPWRTPADPDPDQKDWRLLRETISLLVVECINSCKLLRAVGFSQQTLINALSSNEQLSSGIELSNTAFISPELLADVLRVAISCRPDGPDLTAETERKWLQQVYNHIFLWIDYCSLPQREVIKAQVVDNRTVEEKKLFDASLRCLADIQSAMHTLILPGVLEEGDDSQEDSEEESNRTPRSDVDIYTSRAWCVAEYILCSSINFGRTVDDLMDGINRGSIRIKTFIALLNCDLVDAPSVLQSLQLSITNGKNYAHVVCEVMWACLKRYGQSDTISPHSISGRKVLADVWVENPKTQLLFAKGTIQELASICTVMAGFANSACTLTYDTWRSARAPSTHSPKSVSRPCSQVCLYVGPKMRSSFGTLSGMSSLLASLFHILHNHADGVPQIHGEQVWSDPSSEKYLSLHVNVGELQSCPLLSCVFEVYLVFELLSIRRRSNSVIVALSEDTEALGVADYILVTHSRDSATVGVPPMISQPVKSSKATSNASDDTLASSQEID